MTVDSVGTCALCGHNGPGPDHECAKRLYSQLKDLRSAHEATKRELDDARNVLRLVLTVERSSAINLAQGHFARYGGSDG